MLYQLSYAPVSSEIVVADFGYRALMTESQSGTSADDPVESGALEDEQEGKGYGQDEGEREQALPEE